MKSAGKTLAIAILLPLLVYPVFYGVALVVDSLLGDQIVINWLAFDSRRELVLQFAGDWKASLPVSYGAYVLLWVLGILVSKVPPRVQWPLWWLVAAGFMGLPAWFFAGQWLVTSAWAVTALLLVLAQAALFRLRLGARGRG